MLEKIRHTLELVRFSHSIFALPFGLAAYFVATQGNIDFQVLFWIIICIVCARTAAMAFNRLVDAKFDAQNPRTQNRHLPSGKLSKSYVISLTTLASLSFIFAAAQLNRLCLILAPLCLAILFFYSLTKRFTNFTQIFLGLALGITPIAATIATTGKISLSSVILGFGVLAWVAGFDLLYALQDLEFDRQMGLHSLPAKLGPEATLLLARLLHAVFFVSLILYAYVEKFSWIYAGGLFLIGGLLIWEHWWAGKDPKNIPAAFFSANGLLSLFFLATVVAELWF